MHAILIVLTSAGFGALAWIMLTVSDWLLSDQNPKQQLGQSSNR